MGADRCEGCNHRKKKKRRKKKKETERKRNGNRLSGNEISKKKGESVGRREREKK